MIINKIKVFFTKYPFLKNRYIITLVSSFMWILFFDTNSIISHLKLKKQKKSIANTIENIKKEIAKDKEEIKIITTPKGLEKIAREEYWMKKDNEDLFIIEIK